jgi:hypothetical protein
MAEVATAPARHPLDQMHVSAEVAARMRAENEARIAERAIFKHPAVVARENAEAEAAAEAELLAGDPHQDLAAAEQRRAEAQQAVADCEPPLARARAFVDELRARVQAARENEVMATARLAQAFAGTSRHSSNSTPSKSTAGAWPSPAPPSSSSNGNS